MKTAESLKVHGKGKTPIDITRDDPTTESNVDGDWDALISSWREYAKGNSSFRKAAKIVSTSKNSLEAARQVVAYTRALAKQNNSRSLKRFSDYLRVAVLKKDLKAINKILSNFQVPSSDKAPRPTIRSPLTASARTAIIRKRKDGYHVLDHTGKKNLGGPYKSKGQAVKRLRQVEYFKNKKSSPIAALFNLAADRISKKVIDDLINPDELDDEVGVGSTTYKLWLGDDANNILIQTGDKDLAKKFVAIWKKALGGMKNKLHKDEDISLGKDNGEEHGIFDDVMVGEDTDNCGFNQDHSCFDDVLNKVKHDEEDEKPEKKKVVLDDDMIEKQKEKRKERVGSFVSFDLYGCFGEPPEVRVASKEDAELIIAAEQVIEANAPEVHPAEIKLSHVESWVKEKNSDISASKIFSLIKRIRNKGIPNRHESAQAYLQRSLRDQYLPMLHLKRFAAGEDLPPIKGVKPVGHEEYGSGFSKNMDCPVVKYGQSVKFLKDFKDQWGRTLARGPYTYGETKVPGQSAEIEQEVDDPETGEKALKVKTETDGRVLNFKVPMPVRGEDNYLPPRPIKSLLTEGELSILRKMMEQVGGEEFDPSKFSTEEIRVIRKKAEEFLTKHGYHKESEEEPYVKHLEELLTEIAKNPKETKSPGSVKVTDKLKNEKIVSGETWEKLWNQVQQNLKTHVGVEEEPELQIRKNLPGGMALLDVGQGKGELQVPWFFVELQGRFKGQQAGEILNPKPPERDKEKAKQLQIEERNKQKGFGTDPMLGKLVKLQPSVGDDKYKQHKILIPGQEPITVDATKKNFRIFHQLSNDPKTVTCVFAQPGNTGNPESDTNWQRALANYNQQTGKVENVPEGMIVQLPKNRLTDFEGKPFNPSAAVRQVPGQAPKVEQTYGQAVHGTPVYVEGVPGIQDGLLGRLVGNEGPKGNWRVLPCATPGVHYTQDNLWNALVKGQEKNLSYAEKHALSLFPRDKGSKGHVFSTKNLFFVDANGKKLEPVPSKVTGIGQGSQSMPKSQGTHHVWDVVSPQYTGKAILKTSKTPGHDKIRIYALGKELTPEVEKIIEQGQRVNGIVVPGLQNVYPEYVVSKQNVFDDKTGVSLAEKHGKVGPTPVAPVQKEPEVQPEPEKQVVEPRTVMKPSGGNPLLKKMLEDKKIKTSARRKKLARLIAFKDDEDRDPDGPFDPINPEDFHSEELIFDGTKGGEKVKEAWGEPVRSN